MDVEHAGGPGGDSSGNRVSDGPRQRGSEKAIDGDVCALFARSTPRDVWANPSLAALAALIDEDENNGEASSETDQGYQPSGQVAPESDPRGSSMAAGPQGDGDGLGTGCDISGAASFLQDAARITALKYNKRKSAGVSGRCSGSGVSGGGVSGASGTRQGRREDTRRRRHERRTNPYGAAAAAVHRGRARGSASSPVGPGRRRVAPTAGEMQVAMSLWGL